MLSSFENLTFHVVPVTAENAPTMNETRAYSEYNMVERTEKCKIPNEIF